MQTEILGRICAQTKVDKFTQMHMTSMGAKKKSCRFCKRTIWRFPTDKSKICAMCEMQSYPVAFYRYKQLGMEDVYDGE